MEVIEGCSSSIVVDETHFMALVTRNAAEAVGGFSLCS